MNLHELQERAHEVNARLQKHYKLDDERTFVLAKLAKLTEETGELADEILAYYNLQREEKMEHRTKDMVADELADVVFVAATLADSLGVDLDKAVMEKEQRVKERKGGV